MSSRFRFQTQQEHQTQLTQQLDGVAVLRRYLLRGYDANEELLEQLRRPQRYMQPPLPPSTAQAVHQQMQLFEHQETLTMLDVMRQPVYNGSQCYQQHNQPRSTHLAQSCLPPSTNNLLLQAHQQQQSVKLACQPHSSNYLQQTPSSVATFGGLQQPDLDKQMQLPCTQNNTAFLPQAGWMAQQHALHQVPPLQRDAIGTKQQYQSPAVSSYPSAHLSQAVQSAKTQEAYGASLQQQQGLFVEHHQQQSVPAEFVLLVQQLAEHAVENPLMCAQFLLASLAGGSSGHGTKCHQDSGQLLAPIPQLDLGIAAAGVPHTTDAGRSTDCPVADFGLEVGNAAAHGGMAVGMLGCWQPTADQQHGQHVQQLPEPQTGLYQHCEQRIQGQCHMLHTEQQMCQLPVQVNLDHAAAVAADQHQHTEPARCQLPAVLTNQDCQARQQQQLEQVVQQCNCAQLVQGAQQQLPTSAQMNALELHCNVMLAQQQHGLLPASHKLSGVPAGAAATGQGNMATIKAPAAAAAAGEVMCAGAGAEATVACPALDAITGAAHSPATRASSIQVIRTQTSSELQQQIAAVQQPTAGEGEFAQPLQQPVAAEEYLGQGQCHMLQHQQQRQHVGALPSGHLQQQQEKKVVAAPMQPQLLSLPAGLAHCKQQEHGQCVRRSQRAPKPRKPWQHPDDQEEPQGLHTRHKQQTSMLQQELTAKDEGVYEAHSQQEQPQLGQRSLKRTTQQARPSAQQQQSTTQSVQVLQHQQYTQSLVKRPLAGSVGANPASALHQQTRMALEQKQQHKPDMQVSGQLHNTDQLQQPGQQSRGQSQQKAQRQAEANLAAGDSQVHRKLQQKQQQHGTPAQQQNTRQSGKQQQQQEPQQQEHQQQRASVSYVEDGPDLQQTVHHGCLQPGLQAARTAQAPTVATEVAEAINVSGRSNACGSSSCDFTAWLNQLLQYDGYYAPCTQCGLGNVKYYSVTSPGQVYCMHCLPDKCRVVDALLLPQDSSAGGDHTLASDVAQAAVQPQRQPIQQLQHSTQEQELGVPILLQLQHSGVTSNLGAVHPRDLRALGVNVDDVRVIHRNAGDRNDSSATKPLLLVGPGKRTRAKAVAVACAQSTGSTPQNRQQSEQHCQSCLAGKEHGPQYQYCSLLCKLQAAGIDAFRLSSQVDQQLSWSDIPTKALKIKGLAGDKRKATTLSGVVTDITGSPTARKRRALSAPSKQSICGMRHQLPQQQHVKEQIKTKAVQQQLVPVFPALRLTGPQRSWKPSAWQSWQQKGLAKLAAMTPLLDRSSRTRQGRQKQGRQRQVNMLAQVQYTETTLQHAQQFGQELLQQQTVLQEAQQLLHELYKEDDDSHMWLLHHQQQQSSCTVIAQLNNEQDSSLPVNQQQCRHEYVDVRPSTSCTLVSSSQACLSPHTELTELDGSAAATIIAGASAMQADAVAAQAVSAPATVVLFLLHDAGFVNAAAWQAWKDAHASLHDVQLCCHVKAGVNVRSYKFEGQDIVQQHMLSTRVHAQWGDTSLVQAYIDSLTEILLKNGVAPGQPVEHAPLCSGSQQAAAGEGVGSAAVSAVHNGLRHILLASGHDIPLRLLPAGQLPAGVTLYGSYDYPAEDLTDLQVHMFQGMLAAGFSKDEAEQWTNSLVPHHQWMCISVEHALVLVALRDKILQVADAVNTAWAAEDCAIAADEYIILTALRWAGCIQYLKPVKWLTPKKLASPPGSAANCTPTQVIYPAVLPPGWIEQGGQVVLPGTAARPAVQIAGTAAQAGVGPAGATCMAAHGSSGSAVLHGSGESEQQHDELLAASCAVDKHPVCWKTLDKPEWCEEEMEGCLYALKLSLRQLLAIGASRCALLLRKVDVRPGNGDYEAREAAEKQLTELLKKMWQDDPPAVRNYKRLLIINKSAARQRQDQSQHRDSSLNVEDVQQRDIRNARSAAKRIKRRT